MSHARFRTLYAVRIKGFAETDVVAELARVGVPTVEAPWPRLSGSAGGWQKRAESSSRAKQQC